MLNGFSIVLNVFSILLNVFSIVLNVFSTVLKGFSIELIAFSTVLNAFSRQLNGFRSQLKAFSSELNVFSSQLIASSCQLKAFRRRLIRFSRQGKVFVRGVKPPRRRRFSADGRGHETAGQLVAGEDCRRERGWCSLHAVQQYYFLRQRPGVRAGTRSAGIEFGLTGAVRAVKNCACISARFQFHEQNQTSPIFPDSP